MTPTPETGSAAETEHPIPPTAPAGQAEPVHLREAGSATETAPLTPPTAPADGAERGVAAWPSASVDGAACGQTVGAGSVEEPGPAGRGSAASEGASAPRAAGRGPWEEHRGRAVLARLAAPADRLMGELLVRLPAAEVLAHVRTASSDELLALAGVEEPVAADRAAATRRLSTWRARLAEVDGAPDPIAVAHENGARLVAPGDPEWPTQLEALGPGQPYLLWLRGTADLRHSCLESVSVVGARNCTPYGSHVTIELVAGLAERGWTAVSGGAYGIDGAAHRGALAAGGPTVVVLACGVDVAYPGGHIGLFREVAKAGVLVSEWPPGCNPRRQNFLIRNRVIAALSRGTVIVEAAARSGAINTARYARDIGRPLMAVPGPVTSEYSEGCHMLLREWAACCVTRAAEVLDHVGALGADAAPRARGPVVPRDDLDPVSLAVLDAIPARGSAGPAVIATTAGQPLDDTLRSLGLLAAAGFINHTPTGWRLRPRHPQPTPPPPTDPTAG